MAAFITPPKALARLVGRAVADFSMIRDGDRILLGLSGGKDSLSLLHFLHYLQQRAPVKFELAAMTVDPMTGDIDPSVLIPNLDELGVEYHYVRKPIMELAQQHMGRKSYCSFCSRLKRGFIYQTARENGFNVIALAQHLDDLAESFLMSAFHCGRLQTMKAHYVNDAGDLRIIRPLVYVRERQTQDFAHANGLPVIADSCPACFSMPTQRQHMKTLLATEEGQNKLLFKSLLTTLRPLMSEGLPDTREG
ncbi:MAG: ATP-binding protein [Gammaproteobacteria bacterium]|nr:ATP-binding protein [Gammaproteobacteria bacterium]